MGLEPMTIGATIRYSNQLSYTHQNKSKSFYSYKKNKVKTKNNNTAGEKNIWETVNRNKNNVTPNKIIKV